MLRWLYYPLATLPLLAARFLLPPCADWPTGRSGYTFKFRSAPHGAGNVI
jgi:hypothetical protein